MSVHEAQLHFEVRLGFKWYPQRDSNVPGRRTECARSRFAPAARVNRLFYRGSASLPPVPP
ncbi:MAG: hypothetical protein ABIQ65_03050, partial [Thermoanaerobaculia bacterium]